MTVRPRDVVIRRHPELVVRRDGYLELRRDGDRCAALGGGQKADEPFTCSIYEDRPRACRMYDCRIFAAAGVAVDDEVHKVEVSKRVARWRFDYPTHDDDARQRAVRAAAAYLEAHGEPGPEHLIPESTTRIAVRAVELYEDFLE